MRIITCPKSLDKPAIIMPICMPVMVVVYLLVILIYSHILKSNMTYALTVSHDAIGKF